MSSVGLDYFIRRDLSDASPCLEALAPTSEDTFMRLVVYAYYILGEMEHLLFCGRI